MGNFSADVHRYKDQLRAMILRAELAEGAVLREADLRAESGQSVRVVRHALRDLSDEGLLLRRPRVGTVVLGPAQGRAAPALRSVCVLSSLKHAALRGSTSYLAKVVHGIEAELRPPRQLHLHLRADDEQVGGVDDPPSVDPAELRAQARGVIAVEANHAGVLNELVAAGLAVVAVDFTDRRAAFDSVCVDHAHAGYLATRHLLGLGHRRIAFAGERPSPESSDPTWQERLTGYLRAMVEAGEAALARAVFPIRFRSHQHIAADLPAYHEEERPSAYVLASGSVATAFAEALAAMGLSCPRDVSLACADGIRFETLGRLQLARIRVDYEDLGEAAVRLLRARLAAPATPPVRAIVAVNLETGDSAAAPKA